MNTLLVTLFITKILPVLLPPLIAAVRAALHDRIPSQYIPALLAVGGALVGALGSYLGVDVPDLANMASDAWDGAIIALASTGVHQIWVQHKKGKQS